MAVPLSSGTAIRWKNGVVRDKKTHIEVLTNAIEHVRSNGFSVHGIEFSPITGPKGNIEFLLYLGHEENAAECGMGETELAEAVEKNGKRCAYDS